VIYLRVMKEISCLTSLENLLAGFPHAYVLFSGGRDSLVALHIAKRACQSLDLELTAVHVDTTVSTPGNLDYVKDACKKLDIKLDVVRPKEDFFTLVKRWGFPTVTRRWCCYHLKIEPLKRYFKGKEGIILDGMRMDESSRRKSFPKLGVHRHFKLLCYHPIFEWTHDDVLKYIKKYNLPENPLYKVLPRAAECWCTAFKTVKQFKTLKENWPELFNKFVEAEASLRCGGCALFRGGKKIYLREL